MTERRESSEYRVRQAFLKRLSFVNRPATEIIVAVILGWYAVEIGAVFIGIDKQLFQWLFTTESFPALSPGLFFAIITHALPPRVTHILGNTAVLWIFAGESEQHMQTTEVLGFFLITSLVSVLTGTAVSGDNVVGASGGGYAFIGFYCIHMVTAHWSQLDMHSLSTPGVSNTSLQTFLGLGFVLTPIVIIPWTIAQIAGIIPSGNSDAVGHLIGFLSGISYAAIKSYFV